MTIDVIQSQSTLGLEISVPQKGAKKPKDGEPVEMETVQLHNLSFASKDGKAIVHLTGLTPEEADQYKRGAVYPLSI